MAWFFKHNLIWRHPDGCLICSAIGPKCIYQSSGPIFPIAPHSFLENVLNLLIRNLNLTTSLGTERGANFVSDHKFAHQCLEESVAKMFATVTNYGTWEPKTTKNGFMEKLNHNFKVIHSGRKGPTKSMPQTLKISAIKIGGIGFISRRGIEPIR